MRVFYLFNINDEFKSLTLDNPYTLFKTFNELYNFPRTDILVAYELLTQIISPFNKNKINHQLFNINRNNNFYTKFNNIHIINNYYSDESTELTIKKLYMKIKTTVDTPSFLKEVENKNIFVCDFQNKDYFWLENLI